MTDATTPKKRAPRKPTKPSGKPAVEMMDPDATEVAAPVAADGTVDTSLHAPYSARNCWALETLIAEVRAIYPEATYSISEVGRRQVGIAATFEGWDANHEGTEPSLPQVLACVEADHRVAEVTSATSDESGDNAWVSVRMNANTVTMDQRDTFNVGDAYAILTDGE